MRIARVSQVVAIALLSVLLPSCGGGSDDPTPNPGPAPSPGPAPVPVTPPAVTLANVVSGLSSPVGLESLPDGRLFVVEQDGRIRIIQNGALVAQPFLDITDRVNASSGELGLLGLAFHPSYATNRKFYVNYTRTNLGQLESVISEFQASATNPNSADLTIAERILLTVDQPFENHNGGQLAFGPDGFLYIALGDGGGGGDPFNNGQNLQSLLGKILRIDVNGVETTRQYRIPPDNPFVVGNGLPEIWAYGFRNPWRFSFDSQGGRLFVGDVGQGAREEVDIVQGGRNYGWNIMEGSICFNPSTNCPQTGLTLPIHDYGRSANDITVIGGFVYRGAAIPNLRGFYVFGDFGSGRVWALREETNGTWTRFDLLSTGRSISAFGRDQNGELYLVDLSGSILRIVAQ